MSRVIQCLCCFILFGSGLSAQRLVLDTTFQPFFDIVNHPFSAIPDIINIWENPKTGKIYTVGDFEFHQPGTIEHDGLTVMNRDGSRNTSFLGFSSGASTIIPMSDTTFYIGDGTNAFKIDTTGDWLRYNTIWRLNALNTAQCRNDIQPYFYKNGAALMSKWRGNRPEGCGIINKPDTFPHRYVVKLDSLGNWDSSFVKDADGAISRFIPYDSNRIWLLGSMSSYDGYPTGGLCRIYLDGTLDTTFHNPLVDFDIWFPNKIKGFYNISKTEADGGFFVFGQFALKSDTITPRTLVRLNADGSLDSNFRNHEGPLDTIYTDTVYAPGFGTFVDRKEVVTSIAPMPDGGYLIGGVFNKYQGHPANNIAKIDSNGTYQAAYIVGRGPDSAKNTTINAFTRFLHIIPSKLGGYYVMGDFVYWNGKPSQPIVRLVESNLLVGLEEENQTGEKKSGFKLYPNPAKDEVQVEIETPDQLRQIEIRDLTGRLLQNKQAITSRSKYRLSIADLPKGIYLVSLRLENGSMHTKKLMKQ